MKLRRLRRTATVFHALDRVLKYTDDAFESAERCEDKIRKDGNWNAFRGE